MHILQTGGWWGSDYLGNDARVAAWNETSCGPRTSTCTLHGHLRNQINDWRPLKKSRQCETMRNQFVIGVVVILWLGVTSILCFLCWQAGGSHGPLFLARSSTDVAATLTPVSLSDDLTNTPLRAYTLSVTIVPKPEGLPASPYYEGRRILC